MTTPRVNIYTYMAASNPYFAKALAHKYGYEFDKDQRLDTVLQQLVSYEGEPALMEIIENHPDKDLFKEYFDKKFPENKKEEKREGFGEMAAYMNFTGQIAAAQQTAENKRLTSETSLMVLAGAILIAFAIITKK
jgi:hypothetical protein